MGQPDHYNEFTLRVWVPGAPEWTDATEVEHDRIADMLEECLEAGIAAARSRFDERAPHLGPLKTELVG